MEKIQISTSGVKKSLNKYKPLESLIEYVWNGFDAKAKSINIRCSLNEMKSLEGIEVIHDGYGISKEKLNEKFKPFLNHKKI